MVAKWQDWLSFYLGLWLAVSPWVLGHADDGAATANAVFAGLLLALAGHLEACLDAAVRAEWLNFIAGIWLAAAPFALGFHRHDAAASANSIAVGLMVALLASNALSMPARFRAWWDDDDLGILRRRW